MAKTRIVDLTDGSPVADDYIAIDSLSEGTRRIPLAEVSSFALTSYADLVSLRSEGQLTPSRYYRITDYETIVASDSRYSSEQHKFDIIVFALSRGTLSEIAFAIQNESDNYFDGSNLAAWELRYCLENDDTRFAWASPDGKGVVYYMKDEFGNECGYDFKNITFAYNDTYVFTFNNGESSADDASLNATNGIICWNNVIKPYRDFDSGNILQLNSNRINAAQGVTHDNYIGPDSHDNYFEFTTDFSHNVFEGKLIGSTLTGESFTDCSIGSNIDQMQLGASSASCLTVSSGLSEFSLGTSSEGLSHYSYFVYFVDEYSGSPSIARKYSCYIQGDGQFIEIIDGWDGAQWQQLSPSS